MDIKVIQQKFNAWYNQIPQQNNNGWTITTITK